MIIDTNLNLRPEAKSLIQEAANCLRAAGFRGESRLSSDYYPGDGTSIDVTMYSNQTGRTDYADVVGFPDTGAELTQKEIDKAVKTLADRALKFCNAPLS